MSAPSLRRALVASAAVSIGGMLAVPSAAVAVDAGTPADTCPVPLEEPTAVVPPGPDSDPVVVAAAPATDAVGSDVEVVVQGGPDEPVAGVVVEASPADPADPAVVGSAECTTADDGTCTLPDLPPGTYELTVVATPADGPYEPIEVIATTLDGEVPYTVTVEIPDPPTAEPVEAPPLVVRYVNPELPAACGLRVRLVFDLSTSLSPEEAELVRMAAIGFVDALAGSPLEIAVASFATDAPAAGNVDLGYTSVATPGGALGVRAAIAALAPPSGGDGFTNWDAALHAALAAPGGVPDLVVMLTDGNPTVWGVPAVTATVVTGLDQIVAGVRAANALKAHGTRVVAIGVGDAFEVAATNLAAISGPSAGADYSVTSFAGLPETLARLAGELCPPEPEPEPPSSTGEPEPVTPRFTG